MGYLKYENENLFLEQKNKIILTQYTNFYNFLKSIKDIEKDNSLMEFDGLKLTNKNTIIVDMTSISSMTSIFNYENRIVEEYVKINLDNLNIEMEDELKITNVFKKYLIQLYGDIYDKEFEINYLKILKNNSKVLIHNSDEFLKVLNRVLESDTIKKVFIIYKKSILDYFKLQELEYLDNKKICLFEICDKKSKIYNDDNILIFDREITQIRVDDFFDMILNKSKYCNIENRDSYIFLINKILFYSINKKEVEIMKKYNNEIVELMNILNTDLKINLEDTSDYI